MEWMTDRQEEMERSALVGESFRSTHLRADHWGHQKNLQPVAVSPSMVTNVVR